MIDPRLKSPIAALEAYPLIEGPGILTYMVVDESLPMIPLGVDKDGNDCVISP